jgi:hypothetical protein
MDAALGNAALDNVVTAEGHLMGWGAEFVSTVKETDLKQIPQERLLELISSSIDVTSTAKMYRCMAYFVYKAQVGQKKFKELAASSNWVGHNNRLANAGLLIYDVLRQAEDIGACVRACRGS